jgi:hypothetical protein
VESILKFRYTQNFYVLYSFATKDFGHHPNRVDTSKTIRSHGPDTSWTYVVKTTARCCILLSLVSTHWSSRTLKPDHLSVLDPHASLGVYPLRIASSSFGIVEFIIRYECNNLSRGAFESTLIQVG